LENLENEKEAKKSFFPKAENIRHEVKELFNFEF
jgi:hypothetical protein